MGNLDVPSPKIMTRIIEKLKLYFPPKNDSLMLGGSFLESIISPYTIKVQEMNAIQSGIENDRIKCSRDVYGAPTRKS